MRDENDRLEQTNRELQGELSDLRSRLSQAERSAAAQQTRGPAAAEAKGTDDRRIRQLESMLEDAQEENKKRVMDTPQFKAMKEQVQKKNAIIADLRRRLDRYEPENSKYEDV